MFQTGISYFSDCTNSRLVFVVAGSNIVFASGKSLGHHFDDALHIAGF
jgi:hypothetical protein